MPHVIVKLATGKTEAQKIQLTEAIVKDVMRVMKVGEEAVSVAIEEVNLKDWGERVYQPDIAPNWDKLYQKPGYEPF